jgi:uncharacterized protein YndB with AHSA1/START domain
VPHTSLAASTTISATPAAVFAYVADLTKHGEWSANPLTVAAVSTSPAMVGNHYRSTAVVRGITFTAELTVTDYQAPTRFAFDGHDSTGKFSHRFTFTPVGSGTKVTRRIDFTLSPRQWLMFWVLYFPVRRPALHQALRLLKRRLEPT